MCLYILLRGGLLRRRDGVPRADPPRGLPYDTYYNNNDNNNSIITTLLLYDYSIHISLSLYIYIYIYTMNKYIHIYIYTHDREHTNIRLYCSVLIVPIQPFAV